MDACSATTLLTFTNTQWLKERPCRSRRFPTLITAQLIPAIESLTRSPHQVAGQPSGGAHVAHRGPPVRVRFVVSAQGHRPPPAAARQPGVHPVAELRAGAGSARVSGEDRHARPQGEAASTTLSRCALPRDGKVVGGWVLRGAINKMGLER